VNDVEPPFLGLITPRVSAGRPTIALQAVDRGAGVDPYSLVISYGRVLIGAALYDPVSGIALFPIPAAAPALKVGRPSLVAQAADFQEAKNVDSVGDELLPNSTFARGRLRVVNGPTVSWLSPEAAACAPRSSVLTVLAGSNVDVASVRFLDGPMPLAKGRGVGAGLFTATWRNGTAAKGRHTLRAIVTDSEGRKAESRLAVRVCR
jgi:hypothetical protein